MNTHTLPLPVYFKTWCIFLDDKPEYLEDLELALGEDVCRVSTMTDQLRVIHKLNKHDELLTDWLLRKEDDEVMDEKIISLKINKLYEAMLIKRAVSTTSTLVVDYEMPGMNGLEVCEKITNPYVSKILLTGAVDDSFGVEAINNGTIDNFFRKHDPNLIPKLKKALVKAQESYFRKLYDPILRMLANDPNCALNSLEYLKIFEEKKIETKAEEYYLLDSFGSYEFVLPDGSGEKILVRDKLQMDSDRELAGASIDNPSILSELEAYEKLFYCQRPEGFLECPEADLKKHLLPARKLGPDSAFSYAEKKCDYWKCPEDVAPETMNNSDLV